MTGRPRAIDGAVVETICEHISSGRTIREIGAMDDMPSQATIFRELARNAGFQEQYARALTIRAETMADEILEISDDATNDWMERNGENNEGWQANGEHIQRSRLRVDSRKWLMSKMLPKKYGEKVAVTGADGGPLQYEKIERVVVDPANRDA